ncbi:MAG: SH3 domain-containing protein [Clostridiales bacterium]|nr:SH3 domain-containing protein [Clostridiales bacterium]
MAMKRCPVCGEKYSDTYKNCPFCEEEAALRGGGKVRRGGRRTAGKQKVNLLTPTLIILILIMAALLIYLLFGDRFQKEPDKQDTPPVEEVQPQQPEVEAPIDTEPEGSGMPEDPEGTEQDPGTTTAPAASKYETASKLPDGLTLSTTDFTMKAAGETHTIQVSGGSGSYTWLSEDDGVASVDQNGKVTAISRGTINVLVTDGSKKAVCIVRCSFSGTLTTTPGTGTGTSTPASGTLHTGSAVVINGGNGVNVRSDPSTDHAPLATVPNGASVQIIGCAGDGWYKITFSGVGGVETAGYMKGDFLKND